MPTSFEKKETKGGRKKERERERKKKLLSPLRLRPLI